MNNQVVNVIGGGLAGCECAYQLLKRGYAVKLYEMRGSGASTPCHKTDNLAELVCSNSLKSMASDTGSGQLKAELEILDCLLLRCAYETQVPAGGALAVDRELFSGAVQAQLSKFERLQIVREEVGKVDTSCPAVIATGPLTSDKMAVEIGRILGKDYLYFFDAVAPIVMADSIDMTKAFWGARYNKGDSDYLNCAMDKQEYLHFYNELINAKRAPLHDFDVNVFDGCMPIEIMASRGEDTMRFGPLRPVGITNPHKDERPYAVVQLRKENQEGTMFNIVGFQTNLTFGEQKRVFSLIPGLENMEIVRYGVMHRNTFLNSPKLLNPTFESKEHTAIFFAGQMSGVEGYVESIASGLVCAINMDRRLRGQEGIVFPASTIIGSLQRHISTTNADFQPMNANFGILPPLDNPPRDKKLRKAEYCKRGVEDMQQFVQSYLDGGNI